MLEDPSQHLAFLSFEFHNSPLPQFCLMALWVDTVIKYICKSLSKLPSNCIVNTYCMHPESLQSCPALCDPMDYSLPGSSVHGILRVRILEWVDMTSSGESS